MTEGQAIAVSRRVFRRLHRLVRPAPLIRRIRIAVSTGEGAHRPRPSTTIESIEGARRWLIETAGPAAPTVEVGVDDWADVADADDQRTLLLYAVDGVELRTDALEVLVSTFDQRPDLELAYSDAAAPPGLEPWLLPGWSPERLEDQFYLGQMVALRAGTLKPTSWGDLVDKVGRAEVVAHVPQPLYLRTRDELAIGKKEPRYAGPWPSASIVIPTVGAERDLARGRVVLVEQAVRSVVEQSTYPDLEVVVVTTPGTPDPVVERLERLVAASGCRLLVVHDDRPFNFSNACNRGALAASGDLLVFLNDDTEVIEERWLEHLAVHAVKPSVGAVGAKLYNDNGTIQHCGIWNRGGHPSHRYEGWPGDESGYLQSLQVAQNCLAVTGACLAVERHKFGAVGGFSPVFPNNFNDVDLCLKLVDRGQRSVVEPRAELFHFEASTRDPSGGEADLTVLHDRWRWRLNHDPYDNPNHSAERSEEWPPPAQGAGLTAEPGPTADVRFWPLEPMTTGRGPA